MRKLLLALVLLLTFVSYANKVDVQRADVAPLQKKATKDAFVTYDFESDAQGWQIGTVINEEWSWGVFPHYANATNCIWIDSDAAGSGVAVDSWTVSPVLDLSSLSNQMIDVDAAYRDYSNSILTLNYRINGGDWVVIEDFADYQQWTNFNFVLPQEVYTSGIEFGFHYVGNYAWYAAFDNFSITNAPAPVVFTVSPASINETLDLAGEVVVPVTITNTGLTAFDYTTSLNNAGNDPIILDYDIQTVDGLAANLGSEFDGTNLWITARDDANGHQIVKMDLAGNMIASYPQGTTSTWGMRDLAYDGSFLYAGDENGFYKIDPADGTVTTMFTTLPGGQLARALAILPNGTFIAKNFANSIINFDVDGNVISQTAVATSAYGLAYDSLNDCIWIFGSVGTPATAIVQYDYVGQTLTGVSHQIPMLDGLTDQIVGGLFFHENYLDQAVVGGLVQGTPVDKVFMYSLTPHEAWLSVESGSTGTVAIGENAIMNVKLDAADYGYGVLTGSIDIYGVSGLQNLATNLPITLTLEAPTFDPPSNVVTAYTAGNNFIDVSWDAPGVKYEDKKPTYNHKKSPVMGPRGFSLYNIYLNGVQSYTATETNYTVSDLEAGNYTIGISAVYTNPDGESEIVNSELVNVTIETPLNPTSLNETFEDDSQTLSLWTQIQEQGTKLWSIATGAGGVVTTAHNGTKNAQFTASSGGPHITKLVTPALDLSASNEASLKFWFTQEEWYGDQNELKVYYRNMENGDWTQIAHYDQDVDVWTEVELELPNPTAYYQVAFEGIDNYGHKNAIDDVEIVSVISQVLEFNFDDGVQGWTIGGTPESQWSNSVFGRFSAANTTPSIWIDSDAAGSIDIEDWAITPILNLSGSNYHLIFDYIFRHYGSDEFSIHYRVDGGDWVLINNPPANYVSYTTPFATYDLPLPNEALVSNVEFGFYYKGNYSWFAAIDNVKIEEVTGPQNPWPNAVIDPMTIAKELEAGTTGSETFTITNNGTESFDYSLAFDAKKDYSNFDYSRFEIKTDISQGRVNKRTVIKNTKTDAQLSYHGAWENNGIGTNEAVSFICASRFTADELASYYDSYYINQVNFLISEPNYSNVEVVIWEGGTDTEPGDIVYTTDVTASVVPEEVTSHVLSNPVQLQSGNDYWIGYAIDATGGYPAAVDAGPMVVGKGAWMYLNGAWAELTTLGATLDFNWIIDANITDNPVITPQEWLTITPTTGTINAGETATITLNYDASGFVGGEFVTKYVTFTSGEFVNDENLTASMSVLGDSSAPVVTNFEGGNWYTTLPLDIIVTVSDVNTITEVLGYYKLEGGEEQTFALTEAKNGKEMKTYTGIIPAQMADITGIAYFSMSDDHGNTGMSADFPISWVTENLEIPQNLNAMVIHQKHVGLSWDVPVKEKISKSKSLLGYNVYRDDVKIVEGLTETVFIDSNLVEGTYNYKVSATYHSGESMLTDPVEVIIAIIPTAYTQTELEDSPLQNEWDSNTLEESGWTTFDIMPEAKDLSVGLIENVIVSFTWTSDNWPSEGKLYFKAPDGTMVYISGSTLTGGNNISRDHIIEIEPFFGLMGYGEWSIWIEDSYGDGGHKIENLNLMVEMFTPNESYDLTLKSGWSIISSHLIPADRNLDDLFAPVADKLVLIKDNDGKLFVPELGINEIGDIDVKEGYRMKMSEEAILNIFGHRALPNLMPIDVMTGWNMIGYLKTQEMNVVDVFSANVDDVIIVKNGAGQFYIPSYGMNTIGNMIPGDGYKVKSFNDFALLYPADSKGDISKFSKKVVKSEPKETHYSCSSVTDNNMVLIVTADAIDNRIETGDELAVVNSNGIIAGTAIFENGNIGITVWGDDSTTEIVEGLVEGESFELRVWDASEAKELVAVGMTFENGISTYAIDAVSVITEIESFETLVAIDENLPKVTKLYQNYPNPFNPETTIRFDIATAGKVNISVFNYKGELVRTLVNGNYNIGKISAKWNGTDNRNNLVSNGVYFYRMSAPGYNKVLKAVFVK
ncbi:MAG: hypothetical protein JXR48_00935 [Candidatus Delongbacteria bacterium]|nr:hypothetical protein [Candidatus Delongbacteria bacterium]MBN2833508.1 hypothetical protein [Candidatus Delongbacteria bacterium]